MEGRSAVSETQILCSIDLCGLRAIRTDFAQLMFEPVDFG
jgi:hypothetical protein